MARILPAMASQMIIVFFLLYSFSATFVSAAEEQGFGTPLDPKQHKLKKEKLSHFHFFFHDILSGRNPTAIQVVPPATNTSKTGFGSVAIMDDPLTVGPNLSSKTIGKAQGLYASASQEAFSLLMVMNFAFTEGKYNGSSLSIVGRNPGGTREFPVVGGSGLFRFARGYALATTHSFNLTSGDAVVEYNVYVFHY
ncbi:dirigent protein 21-like [Corylus avellana]|uniref:dirigent protein 21-like n=1 Tax=Corylus avellana TaxID=13451 RepID=UPI001E203C91|nr:dirigent protein 21-like [Corylus avellana]